MKLLLILALSLSTVAYAGKKPTARMVISPETGYLPLEVQFNGQSSSDPEGEIVSYEWSFGDGGTATGPVVSHLYQTNRVENAKLTVTDSEGKKDTAHYILKFGKDRVAPVVSFDIPENFRYLISTPLLTINYQDATSKVNFSASRILLDGQDITSRVVFENSRALIQFTPEWPLTPGNHMLVAEISDYYDNVAEKSLLFSYVATTNETAFLTAKLIDVDGSPISGVVAESVSGPVNAQIRAVSAGDGSVSIPFTTGGDYRIQFTKSGFVRTFKYASLVKGHGQSLEEVMMAEADPKVTFVSATQGGVASNSTNTISLSVHPNSIPTGLNFSFTEAVTGKTLEIPLPNGSHFTYAHDAQPSGTVFSTPADMSIRNILGFRPGAEIPVGVTDELLGVWSDSGHKGIVSADGEKISYKVDHFSSYDVNYPTIQRPPVFPPQVPPSLAPSNPTGNPCPCDPGTVPGSRIGLGSGNVSVDYKLPSVIRQGRDIAKTFTYASSSVSRQSIIGAQTKGLNAKFPSGFKVEIKYGDQYFKKEFHPSTGVKNSNFYVAFDNLLPNSSVRKTGSYRYDITGSSTFSDRIYGMADYFGGPGYSPDETWFYPAREAVLFPERTSGWVVVNNQEESPFGKGWNLSGYEQLFEDTQTGVVTLTKGNELNTYYLPINPGAGNPVVQKRVSEDVHNLQYHKGFVYGADCANNQVFRIDSAGRYTTLAGGSPFRHLSLSCPKGIFPSRKGGYYITDSGNRRIVYLNQDGSYKVLATAERGNIQDPSFITEDNVLAAHFIDGDEVKTISPHDGKILTMVGDNEGAYFKYKLKEPSQIHYDDFYNLVVLDSGLKKMIKFYIASGTTRVILKDISSKELALDPVRKNYYLLTKDGELRHWQGWGHEKTTLLDTSTETFKVFDPTKGNKKNFQRYNSIAFSPLTGLVMSGENGIALRALDSRKKTANAETSYISYVTDVSKLVKLENGRFERRLPDDTVYEFYSNGKLDRFLDKTSLHFEQYEYLSNGKLASINFSHNRGVYSFAYDSNGMISSVTDPVQRTTQFSVNDQKRLVAITSPDNLIQSYVYNSKNQLIQRADESNKISKYTYEMGRITSVTKPGNRTFEFQDNILSNLLAMVSGTDLVIPLEPKEVGSSFIYPEAGKVGIIYGPAGLSQAEIDGKDFIEWISRDPQGFPIQKLSPEGREIRQKFDSYGNVIERFDMNGKESFVWNTRGKLEKFTDAFNNSFVNSYSSNGLLEASKTPHNAITTYAYNTNNYLTEITDPLSAITKLAYDLKGNLASVIDPIGVRTTFSRDDAGNVASVTDALKHMTTFEYDLQGRIVKTIDAKSYVTEIDYSPTGEVESVRDAKNQVTSFEYNDFAKVTSVRNPANMVTHYTYDLNGNILTKTTKDSSVISFEYDANQKLISKNSSAGVTTFNYDKDGALVFAGDNDSEVSFSYDHVGRLVSETSNHYPGKIVHKYNIRGDREVTSLYLGNDISVEFYRTYGAVKEISRNRFWVDGADGEITSSVDLLGRPSIQTLPNGIQRNSTYDKVSRIVELEFAGPSFQTLQSYNYNPVGSIISTSENVGGLIKESRYAYDELQRLVHEDSIVKSKSYDLDPLGNDQSTGFVHNNVNQVLSSPDYTYEYDDNGNRTRKTSRYSGERFDYTWTAENQLTSVKIYRNGQLALVIGYKYDGIGRRIMRTVTDQFTPSKSYSRKYVYDGHQVIAILDGINKLLSAYVFGSEIDHPSAMVTDYDGDGDLDVLSLHLDHLGSVRMITNSGRQIVEEIHYSAYGETQIKRRGQSKSRVINNYYYTGREMEAETGDYYYRARYYDPYSQKFLSEDPIGMNSGDVNKYRYVLNNPIKYKDPSGLVLEFGCDTAKNQFQNSLVEIYGTSKGQELIDALQNTPTLYTININYFGQLQKSGFSITVDPTVNPLILTSLGPLPASTTRIIAHELGHLTGERDNGPGRMNNVNNWENPIMEPIEGFVRIGY